MTMHAETTYCPWIGPWEISDRLGVPRATIDTWHHRGFLPAPWLCISRRPVWHEQDIAEWAESVGKAYRIPDAQ